MTDPDSSRDPLPIVFEEGEVITIEAGCQLCDWIITADVIIEEAMLVASALTRAHIKVWHPDGSLPPLWPVTQGGIPAANKMSA